MSNEGIVIKGTPQKNKPALIIIIVGAVLLLASFLVASYVFENCIWRVIYDSLGEFFTSEFFNFECFYGYMILLGIVALIVGFIIKSNTEKCEITVTNDNIIGKLPHGKEVNIPLNQVTALNHSSFNGISVSSIGNVSNFHCFENRDEVMKAISYLLANPQQGSTQTVGANATATASATGGTEAEQLKRLKELFDSGVLTQEEFDTKKKQILGL